jgi:hypothetical protein
MTKKINKEELEALSKKPHNEVMRILKISLPTLFKLYDQAGIERSHKKGNPDKIKKYEVLKDE